MNRNIPILVVVALLAAHSTLRADIRPALPAQIIPENRIFSASWHISAPISSSETLFASPTIQPCESGMGWALDFTDAEARIVLPIRRSDGRENFSTRGVGTLRFYFAPEAVAPGQRNALLQVGTWSADGLDASWSLELDTASGTLRLVALAAGVELAEVLSAKIDVAPGVWRQVALTWTSGAEGKTILYWGGRPVAEGPGVDFLPLRASAQGVPAFALSGRGQYNDLVTLGYVSRSSELSWHEQQVGTRLRQGPISLQEKQALLAAKSAESLGGSAQSYSGDGPPPFPPPGGGSTNNSPPAVPWPPFYMTASNYCPCVMWLHIGRPSNGTVTVTLMSTVTNGYYRLLCNTNGIATTNWQNEGFVFQGKNGQTPTNVSIANRPIAFFRAVQVSNVVSTNFVIGPSFAGLTGTNGRPDAMGAIGVTNFVELINGRIAFYATNGTCLGNCGASSSPYFGTNSTVNDPRLVWDALGRRWVATGLTFGNGRIYFAVSKGTNAVGATNWTSWILPVAKPGQDFVDHPTLGINAEGIYLSYIHGNGASNGIIVINKSSAYSNTTDLAWTHFMFERELMGDGSYYHWRTIQPVVSFDPNPFGGYAWFLAKGPRETNAFGYKGGAVLYNCLKWSNGVPCWRYANFVPIVAPELSYRLFFDLDREENGPGAGTIGAPQKGGPSRIILDKFDSSGSRLHSAISQGCLVWACHHVGLASNGSYPTNYTNYTGAIVTRTGIQWLQLRMTLDGQLVYHTHGRIYDTNAAAPNWYYHPSMAVNPNGDIALGFSGSSSNTFVSTYFAVTTWRHNKPLTSPILLKAGLGYFAQEEWGDYSFTTLDPNDNTNFWTIQEYAVGTQTNATNLEGIWGDWITKGKRSP